MLFYEEYSRLRRELSVEATKKNIPFHIMKWLHSELSASHVTALRHHVLVSVTDNFIRGRYV